jgi:carbamate kinase
VALGGNAIARPSHTDPDSQRAAVDAAMDPVAELVVSGYEVAVTHGNGPQVGNLLVKNELASSVVPPVPLDWCVAQTQATIGYLIVTALERALQARGSRAPVVMVLSRVLVDPEDPGLEAPAKPIGRHLPEARARMDGGEAWKPQGARGWRRVVPSPEPREMLDADAAVRLLDDGAVVVAAGGGGIPMVRAGDRLEGIEAVLDKDLSAALLARTLSAELLLIATDVEGVATDYGTPDEHWLERVSAARLRELAGDGHFAGGSMRPKVEACLRFVESGGARAVIASLERLGPAARGEAGTIVEREPWPA